MMPRWEAERLQGVVMHVGSQPSPNAVLGKLHAETVGSNEGIVWLLKKASDQGLVLQGRRTLKGNAEQARITAVSHDHIVIKGSNLEHTAGSFVLLSFSTEGRTYSFAARALDDLSGTVGRIALPTIIYVAERRERQRHAAGSSSAYPSLVTLRSVRSDWVVDAHVDDYSPVGLNVRLRDELGAALGESLEVTFGEGGLNGGKRWGQVRYVEPEKRQDGWKRVGLSLSEVPHSQPIEVERRPRLSTRMGRLRTSLSVLSAGARSATSRVFPQAQSRANPVEVVDFSNERGERIRGIIDRSHSGRPTAGVIIPPAWGRTKETLLPLAMTIAEVFREAGERVAVLRFDGTRRRGESFKDPGCEKPGLEHLTFTFSHAADDIIAASEFVTGESGLGCEKCVLVTFSAASIEGRRAILKAGSRIDGWVSVVGTPDLQSGLRAVSGGVDYVGGAERGIRFGLQEIMGVLADMDTIMDDALREQLPFLEDARREMQGLALPITWIHGAHDGWLDMERVREIMSCVKHGERRLIEVPTGHQLRSSLEALEVFQLVAQEVAKIALGRTVRSPIPSLVAIESKRVAERSRLPKVDAQLGEFWRDYLVGRDGRLGIELMTATSAYADLMRLQIDGLRLKRGDRVADIGSGTGSFPIALLGRDDVPVGLRIHEVDFVEAAQARARERLDGSLSGDRVELHFSTCDLDNAASRGQLLLPNHFDSILLSLVLGYLSDPVGLLKDLRGSIRDGGRLVVSVMRRDADVSRLFVDAMSELRAGRAREVLGEEGERLLDISARHFLNDAARVLDLEEAGIFRFLDAEELRQMLVESGFQPVEEHLSFGNPPQAVVLIAEAST